MKSVIKRIISNIKNNKFFYLVCLFIILCLVFTHSNTFLANDDLPYSYYFRSEKRITNIIQVLKNQAADYLNINGRIMVHSVLQIVLIFGKKLWMVINPIMIVGTIALSINIASKYSEKQNKIAQLLLGFSLFLSLVAYKNIIYWVAGSVNYVWTYALLAVFLTLYYRYGFIKNKIINMVVIFFLTALHECTMVFTISFVLMKMLYDWYKDKRFNKDYIWYILSISGSFVLLLSPANQLRLIIDPNWNQMNLIQKLTTAIPVVSQNLFNLLDFKNIIAYVFILSIIMNLVKNKSKVTILIVLLIVTQIVAIIIFKNKWLYTGLVLLLVIGEYYGNVKSKRVELCFLSLSFYAVVYSNIITPLYFAGRPNYFFYMYMIIFILITFNDYFGKLGKKNKLILIILSIIFTVFMGNELVTYNKIGNIHRIRLEQIEDYKKQGQIGPLILKRIPDKYGNYHMDINLPQKDWFTYRYFVTYYNLNNDIEIKFE